MCRHFLAQNLFIANAMHRRPACGLKRQGMHLPNLDKDVTASADIAPDRARPKHPSRQTAPDQRHRARPRQTDGSKTRPRQTEKKNAPDRARPPRQTAPDIAPDLRQTWAQTARQTRARPDARNHRKRRTVFKKRCSSDPLFDLEICTDPTSERLSPRLLFWPCSIIDRAPGDSLATNQVSANFLIFQIQLSKSTCREGNNGFRCWESTGRG